MSSKRKPPSAPSTGSVERRSCGVVLGDALFSVQPSEAQAITLARNLRTAFQWLVDQKILAEMPVIKVGHKEGA